MEFQKVSFVIPVFNEQHTLAPLCAEITRVMEDLGYNYEILFVDDGSLDFSWVHIQSLSETSDSVIRGIRLRRNFGKATALAVGFAETAGDIVITLDADLQDLPHEVPRFLAMIEAGYDLVTGWKKKRHDPLSKTFPSKVFNFLASKITGVKLHDFNCGFKAYRREVVNSIELYGELHRFTPALAHAYGFKIGELPIEHSPRKFGSSKYGLRRIFHGLMDLLTVVFTTRFVNRPGHLLGGVGVLAGVTGGTSILYLITLKYVFGESIGTRPLLLFGIMLVLLSVQLLSIGLVAELVTRGTRTKNYSRLIAREVRPHPHATEPYREVRLS